MQQWIFRLVLVAISLTIVLFSPIPTVSQSNPAQPDLTINSATRSEVIESVIENLGNYVFPDMAKQLQSDIRTQFQNGKFNNITSAIQLAQTLTSQIQAISRDKHLNVMYSHEPFLARNEQGEPIAPQAKEQFYQSNAWQNFGFYKVERLAGNVGYLDFRFIGFPPLKAAGNTAIAAMNFLNNTRALIIDVRQSRGGHPSIITLVSTYLFDGYPVHLNDLYWREKDVSGVFRERIEQYWTLPSVPGKRYLNKEVYVLTSKDTFSASEEFAYNLKQLKRAGSSGSGVKIV